MTELIEIGDITIALTLTAIRNVHRAIVCAQSRRSNMPVLTKETRTSQETH